MNRRWSPGEIRRMIRRDAEMAMRREWFPTMVMVFLYFLLSLPIWWLMFIRGYLLDWRGSLVFVAQLLLLGPYTMGMRRWYLRAVRGQHLSLRDVFYFYHKNRYSTALIVTGFFQIVEFILSLVCTYMLVIVTLLGCFYLGVFWSFDLIPMYLNESLSQRLELFQSPAEFMLAVVIGTLILLVLCVIRFGVKIFMVHYTCAYNLCVDYENWSLSALFAKSKSVMRGTTLDMARMYIGFLPWAVPILLTGGLAMIYVFPYFYMTETLYLEYFRDCYQKNKSIYIT
ncbi:MAG: DUF975 family protein [Eubacteriales bacterium]